MVGLKRKENMFDVIIIGGGPAGVTAALRSRELGASVGLIERDRMGGICTNDGCVPTRVLAKAARLVRDANQYPNYGLSGEPPVVDLAELISRAQETVYRVHEKKQLLANLRQAGVTVWEGAGMAHFVDDHTLVLADGQSILSEKFILCAGGHARRLNFPGAGFALTHSDVWRLEKLPESAAIIGGAATGCQLASILAALGTKVSILDVAPTILGVEDPTVRQQMTASFTGRGIKIDAPINGVEKIERYKDGLRLHYTQDDMSKYLDVELIIMAVGWVGNVAGLNLDAAGVEANQGYVLVDDLLQTTAPHIFAAGDITGRMMLVQSASHEARVAAENAILGTKRSFRHDVVPHGGFTDPEYASVGLTEDQAKDFGEYASAVVPYADLDRAVIDGRVEGFCKLIVSAETGNLLGAHVVGEQAVEVVQIAAAGMAASIDIRQLAELELAYPTFTAVIGLAARQLVRRLGLTPLAPEWRALGKVNTRVAGWEVSSL
jgi:pyruvate/2-oxoglutarate dehydrogenase complex dihydrolipoamide dehydrogenase (E3) component